jgi:hypothetical protein
MKYLVFGLLALTCSLSPQATTAQEYRDQAAILLTASVFNDADVEPSVLSQAQDRASQIMSRSGISLTWLDCGSPLDRIASSGCSAIAFPKHLSVRIVPKVSPVKGHIFGQSFQDAAGEGNYVLVYFAGLMAFKPSASVSTGELLGCVVAHELGHLLLGSDSHSATGLMSAVWQEPELRQVVQGNLLFTSDQRERMRSRFLAAARLGKVPDPRHSSSGK